MFRVTETMNPLAPPAPCGSGQWGGLWPGSLKPELKLSGIIKFFQGSFKTDPENCRILVFSSFFTSLRVTSTLTHRVTHDHIPSCMVHIPSCMATSQLLEGKKQDTVSFVISGMCSLQAPFFVNPHLPARAICSPQGWCDLFPEGHWVPTHR